MKYYQKLFFIFLSFATLLIVFALFTKLAHQAPKEEKSLIKESIIKEADAKDLAVAADFNLKDIYGTMVKLSSYKDKQPVILFFWTTWCPFCRQELKLLNDIYPQLQKDGVELLAINIAESEYKVNDFYKNYGLTFKVLLDKGAAVAYIYEILGVPTYIFINKKGYIVFREHAFLKGKYKMLILD